MTAETIYNACIEGSGIFRTMNVTIDLLREVNERYPDILITHLHDGIYEFRPKPESICIADDAGIVAYRLRHHIYQRLEPRN